ncbi:hypothetical protein IWW34DRAFT_636240 [Fusarium oxysporum f. sp. albedinis]|uniref:F-box domain-containing protein n=1 Tax=Fusarium oxysporum (strain Fo5176) TaxID=660025 RepID=F9GDG9_FUSOF|nr:hypothetical protein FOXB_16703 [Fusarium oxysporum f. sp. conglutinans Fo5176]KAI3573128.1 hypothetical protein IWW34DRAFT_636240 [Fusarium oxysporum f. sp. albedinis]
MTTNYLAKLPQEVKDHVGRYLDLKSIARARLASKGMNFFLPSERAKLNRHSRVWGSIMRSNDWNERLWGIVAKSYGGNAEDYDMVLLGSDLEFLYYADDERKKPPPDYGPLHLWGTYNLKPYPYCASMFNLDQVPGGSFSSITLHSGMPKRDSCSWGDNEVTKHLKQVIGTLQRMAR